MENMITLLVAISIIVGFFIAVLLKNKRHKEKQQYPVLFLSDKAEAVSNSLPKSSSSDDLIQKATELKSNDTEQSIQLLREALTISKGNKFTIYFKLANYYHYSGKIEEAYSIYNNLLLDLNINNVFDYNKTKAQILEKKCILNYKNEEYENYLFNYCYWLFNKIIGLACQGESVELKEIIYNKNKLNYLSQSKLNGSFKKLKIESFQRQFNTKLSEYFNSIQDDLLLLSKLSKNIQKNKKAVNTEDALRQNESFMVVYSKLNPDSFIEFYKSNILLSNNDS